jgi:hypothetical protein
MVYQMIRYITLAILLTGLLSCSSQPEKLGTLDLKKWRGDRGSCDGIRTQLVDDFKTEQKQLMGKFADEIGELLGRPDIHQLGERNQKFYVYFLEKGTHCDDIKAPSKSNKVILKFNAVGLLSEITYQERPL